MQGSLGAVIGLESEVRPSALLLGETTGRAIVTFAPEARVAVESAAKRAGVPLSLIGRVGGERLRISVSGRLLIDQAVGPLAELWRTAFVRAIEAAEVL
jgi:phosphoribosylformylglycinamidine synthase